MEEDIIEKRVKGVCKKLEDGTQLCKLIDGDGNQTLVEVDEDGNRKLISNGASLSRQDIDKAIGKLVGDTHGFSVRRLLGGDDDV